MGSATFLWVVSSGAEKEIVRRNFLGAILVSPDGKFIATESVDPTTNEPVILLVPTDGAPTTELMRAGSALTAAERKQVQSQSVRLQPASWTSDSRSLLVKLPREREGAADLWLLPVGLGALRKLPTQLEPGVFAFKISPDGRLVTYRVKESEPAPAASNPPASEGRTKGHQFSSTYAPSISVVGRRRRLITAFAASHPAGRAASVQPHSLNLNFG